MTTQYKDLFISYGRRESLGFVARLHQRLKLAGYEAWFDKVNIPDGEDYAARISHGIESAHNFVYVMAPRALCSPYCLIEIEYARYLGKRVIPINQMVIFQTEDKPLSDGDQAVLHGFYARYGLDDPNITTTQQVLERSLASIGRTDWLDGKEKLSDEDCSALFSWAQEYENFWHKHEDLNYLQLAELPQFGQSVDSLASIIERMQIVLERHKKHVAQHTDLMMQALMWSQNQYANHYLLVGKERTAAEDWLAREFRDGEQAPCEPNALLCDFICESRKNGENRLTDCFICYASEDKAVRDAVINSLARYAITTWRHDKDIVKGQTYDQAIEAGIEGADNVLFFVSPESVRSEYCLKELQHALQYNKRLIPLLITETAVDDIPEAVRGLQCVDFTDNQCQQDYDSDIADILNIVRQDATYYEHHKVLLVQALRWQRQQQQSSFLLRGHNLENAKTWLRLNQEREQHAPLELHRELITVSEAAKGRLRTDVFLSYSRKDGDFARKLNLSLQAAGKNVWFDQESIASGMDFEAELYKGINGADNFVFVLSPDSVTSEYCEDEVSYALSQGKRIFTVLCRDTDPETLPPALRNIHWLDFLNTPFDKSFAELIQALDLDREHAAQHTVLQQRALEWSENQQSADFLLNSSACNKAEVWQETAQVDSKQPAPTALQQSYIQNSRSAITAAQRKEKRRQQWILTSVSLGLVFALILAFFSWLQMQEAEKQKAIAEGQTLVAEEKTREAEEQKAIAEQQKSSALAGQSRLLSKQIELVGKSKPATAMRLALEALPKTSETYPERPLVKEAYESLAISLNRHFQGIFEHEESVDSAEFSPDSKRFLTRSGKVAYVWDISSRQIIATLEGHEGYITSATYSPDGSRIVTASYDNTARVWDSNSGKLVVMLQGHENDIWSATYNPDGNRIVTTSEDGTARVWDSNNGQLIVTLKGHENRVTSASYSQDGSRIVTVSDDKTARVWDSNSGKLIVTLKGHKASVSLARYSPNGSYIVTASSDKTARVWDSNSGKLIVMLKGHEDSVSSLSYSPDGSRIVTASGDGTARVWDSNSGGLIVTLQGHEGSVYSARYSPDGSRIVTASYDNTTRVWNSSSGELIVMLKGHEGGVNSARYSPDGIHIITASSDKTARVWDSSSGGLIVTLKGHENTVRTAAFSPDGSHIVTASTDKTARVWDSNSGGLIFTLKGHEAAVTSARYSPDGSRIVTASYDNTARVWDSNSGELIVTLQGHENPVYSARYSPDGSRIVTASEDKTARVWDSNSGELIVSLKGHENPVYSAMYSPDGNHIVTSSFDNTARIWINLPSLEDMSKQAQAFLPKKRHATGAEGLSSNLLLCQERKGYFLDVIERCAEIGDENIRGSEYQGEFDANTGKAHGQGETYGINHYKGGFKQGLKHGYGVYTWADGTVWEGEFKDDLAMGIGALEASTTSWYEAARYTSDLDKTIALLQLQFKILPKHANSFVLWGEILVKQNQTEQAIGKFKQALALDTNLTFDPEIKVKQVQAEALIHEAYRLDFARQADEILQKIEQALQLNAETVDANSLNEFCWLGAVKQHAKEVLKLCELAVKKAPSDENIIDSRGLARALTGDINGAIEDFRFFVANSAAEELVKQRQTFITALENGENPFTEEVLNRLR